MHARPHQHEDIGGIGHQDPAEFRQAASALRERARASTASIRELLRGHVELDEDDATEPSEGRDGVYWRHEAERIREEIDQLVGLYEAASHGRPAGSTPRAPRRRSMTMPREPQRDDFMRKAFMFLMLSELM
jgi:hypothetical protein